MTTTVKDLSEFHDLIADLFRWPTSPEEWAQYRLTDEQVAFYREYGYVAGIKMLEEWQIDRLNKELLEIMHPEHPGN